MAFDDRARRRLADILDEHLGNEGCELLMAQLPPQGWDELATKTDLALLKTDIALVRADLEQVETRLQSRITAEIAGLRTDLTTDIADLRTDLTTDIAGLRTDLTTDIAGLRTDLTTGIAGLSREVSALRAEMHRSQRQLTITLVGVMTVLIGVLGVLDQITG